MLVVMSELKTVWEGGREREDSISDVPVLGWIDSG